MMAFLIIGCSSIDRSEDEAREVQSIAFDKESQNSSMNVTANPSKWMWEYRVIILSGDDLKSDVFEKQRVELDAQVRELEERDILLVEIGNERGTVGDREISETEKAIIIDRFDLNLSRNEIILIGKDGGIKLRENVPYPLNQINALIDSMPMRQAEMKRGNT